MQDKEKKMDCRCPLGLNDYPATPCPLALKRLERLKALQGTIQHNQEETWNDDCPYAINDKASNYCFFAYLDNNEGVQHSIIDIAELTCNTQAATYSALHRALEQVRVSKTVRNLKSGKV